MPRLPLLRPLAAAALGLALSIGSVLTPMPAAAQSLQLPDGQNQAAIALGALVALGVLGAVLSDDDDDDDDRDRDRHRDRDRVQVYRHAPDYGQASNDRVLPADCVRRLDGGQRVVAGQCLERRGYYAGLPGHCRSSVYSGDRYRAVYGLRCLRDSGFYVR